MIDNSHSREFTQSDSVADFVVVADVVAGLMVGAFTFSVLSGE